VIGLRGPPSLRRSYAACRAGRASSAPP
jgi:hypothetical protein